MDSYDDIASPAAGSAGAPARHHTRGRSRTKQWVAAAAVVGALLGTTGIAMAQTADGSSGTSDGTATEQVDRSQAMHPGEELLTGDTAAQVTAAAQKEVPDGTVDRVETDAEGSRYEAHVTKADGTRVTVKVDADFNVTTVETDQGRGPGGPGRPGMPGAASPSGQSTSV